MTSSLIPTVTDALVSVLDAALSIDVFDGPVRANTERAGLTVGAAVDSGRWPWDQEWATLATIRPREETVEIPCALWVKSGDDPVSTLRTELFGYWATVEATLRSNHTLGISTNSLRTLLRPTEYLQQRTPEGVVCRLDFLFRFIARI